MTRAAVAAEKPGPETGGTSSSRSSRDGRMIGLCFLVNGLSSVTMMIGNKHLANVFPFPFLTILLQNGVVFVVCVAILWSVGTPKPLRVRHVTSCIPVSVATSLVLSTSIVALRYSSVPLIVTFRNMTPVVCAFMEYLLLGGGFDGSSKIGLLCGLCGGWLYSVYDPPRKDNISASHTNTSLVFFNSNFGLVFVCSNLVLSAIVVILEAITMRGMKDEQSPTAVNCIRIGLMFPILLTFSLVFEDHSEAKALLLSDFGGVAPGSREGGGGDLGLREVGGGDLSGLRKKNWILACLLVTGVFAALFGISGLTLTKLKLRPTTLAFMNTLYKVVTTMVGHFVFPVVVPFLSWMGYLLAFAGFLLYTLGKMRRPDAPIAGKNLPGWGEEKDKKTT